MLFFLSGKKGDLKELAKDLRENFPEISENFDIVKKVGEGEWGRFFGKSPLVKLDYRRSINYHLDGS